VQARADSTASDAASVARRFPVTAERVIAPAIRPADIRQVIVMRDPSLPRIVPLHGHR